MLLHICAIRRWQQEAVRLEQLQEEARRNRAALTPVTRGLKLKVPQIAAYKAGAHVRASMCMRAVVSC